MNPGLQDSTPVQLEPSPAPDTVPLGREGGRQESGKGPISHFRIFEVQGKENWFMIIIIDGRWAAILKLVVEKNLDHHLLLVSLQTNPARIMKMKVIHVALM